MKPRIKNSSASRPQRGQTLMEFALILALLLLVVMGIIDFGRILFIYSNLFNAAREGARHGAVDPWDAAEIQSNVRDTVSLVDPDDVSLSICCDRNPSDTATFYCNLDTSVPWSCDDATATGSGPEGKAGLGDRVVVSISYDLRPLTPLVLAIVPELPIRTESARTIATLGSAFSPPSPGGGSGSTDPEICDNGVDDDGDSIPDCADSDCATAPNCRGEISVTATADPDTVYSGEAVLFTYTVQNTGQADLTDVSVTDSLGNTISAGDLAAGATVIRTLTENINTTTANTVTASGIDPTLSTVSASTVVTVTVVGPALDLTVAASSNEVYRGEVVTFTYTVENTGDADLSSVTVVDSLGTTISPVNLPVGSPAIFWDVPRTMIDHTTNDVTASGTDPLGTTVSDDESILVRLKFHPIVIYEPLEKDSTVVTGTAEPGLTVYIRDLMDPTFPTGGVLVQTDGSFEFTGLPPLVPRHVIVVEGYGKWDSSVVIGEFAPIEILTALCHGGDVVTGTAEPGYLMSLVIAGLGYEDHSRADPSGVYTFTLPAGQPLQYGQIIGVSGYDETAVAMVEACTTDAYIVISPQCGNPATNVYVNVAGYNFGGNNWVDVCWDGTCNDLARTDQDGYFSYNMVVRTITEGTHTVSAERGLTTDSATFVSPCPAPNLVVTAVELLTTGTISTYQPLDFRVTVANIGTKPVNNLFWTDIYPEYPAQADSGAAWAAVSTLGTGDTAVLTITLAEGFVTTGTHEIWALSDSWDYVWETNEGDNVGGPATVEVVLEGTPPVPPVGTGAIAGETWVSLAGIPAPHARATVVAIHELGYRYTTFSDESGTFLLDGLPAGSYTVIGESWISGVRYSRVYYNVIVSDGATSVRLIMMYAN